MKTTRLIVIALVFIIGLATIFFTSSTTAASAPALLGITLTPTDTVAPTATPYVPTITPTAMPSPTPIATANPIEVDPDDEEDDPLENVVFLPPAGFGGEAQGDQPDLPSFVFGEPARLVIPDLHVSSPVLGVVSDGYTWDIRGLGASVGWLAETGRPSEPGNVVMVGHVFVENGSPFKNLKQLVAGDEIRLVTSSQQYVYRVTSARMVDPQDTSVLRSDGRHLLTLITCAQFDAEQNMYIKRLVVTAELIQKAGQTVTAE